jgi:Myb-like DNA-binding domain
LKSVKESPHQFKCNEVAYKIPNTSASPCKYRCVSKVKEWSPLEDAILFQAYYDTNGPKWIFISNFLHGRTETNVKNRFHHIKRRLEKLSAKLDINRYAGDSNLKQRIIETATRLEVPWDLIMTVVDPLVHSLKEEIPLLSMTYEYYFDLIDVTCGQISCSRCGLIIPSTYTGSKNCCKTGWCQVCTGTPAYLFGNLLRMHHSLRYSYRKSQVKQNF